MNAPLTDADLAAARALAEGAYRGNVAIDRLIDAVEEARRERDALARQRVGFIQAGTLDTNEQRTRAEAAERERDEARARVAKLEAALGRALPYCAHTIDGDAIAALLSPTPSPEATDFLTLATDFHRWSEEMFGPGPRTHGLTDHIRKELAEIEADPDDVEEWIDVMLLALNGAMRRGVTARQVVDAMARKHAKNLLRKWPDWRTAPPGAIEHIRSPEAAPVEADTMAHEDAPCATCGGSRQVKSVCRYSDCNKPQEDHGTEPCPTCAKGAPRA